MRTVMDEAIRLGGKHCCSCTQERGGWCEHLGALPELCDKHKETSRHVLFDRPMPDTDEHVPAPGKCPRCQLDLLLYGRAYHSTANRHFSVPQMVIVTTE